MATPAEITASLTMDDIPIKLRCAACNRLANNAFRMPCCDQSICGDCYDSLPQACPVCLHEPVSTDDCRPNKALRTTVKAFLRRKGIEMEAAKKKEQAEKAKADPPASDATKDGSDAKQASQVPTGALAETEAPDSNVKQEESNASSAAGGMTTLQSIPPEREGSNDAQKDIPKMSIESPDPQEIPKRASTQGPFDTGFPPDTSDGAENQRNQVNTMGQHEQWNTEQNVGPMFGNNGSGFDGMNGGFPNMGNMGNMGSMGFNGVSDFSQMMQFMPNGMSNNMMGGFPNVMGMSGMGMDPMAMSQGLYGGFGGPGMGMNSMNTGMGFDAGQNAFGGFNGHPPNQDSYVGQMGGNFGPSTGFGGYNMPQNQGNYNRIPQHQNFNNDFQHGHQNSGFQYRGRGRGRGNYYNAGRGRGFVQPYQGRQANVDTPQAQSFQPPQRRGSPEYTPMVGPETEQPKALQNSAPSTESKPHDIDIQQKSEEQQPKDPESRDTQEDGDSSKELSGSSGANEQVSKVDDGSEQDHVKSTPSIDTEKAVPIPSVLSEHNNGEQEVIISPSATATSPTMPPPSVPHIPTGPASQRGEYSGIISPRGRGFGRGFSRAGSYGRGSFSHQDSISRTPSYTQTDPVPHAPSEPKGLGVEGAPKAPKALRQGLPNTGIRPPQDTGFSIVGRASASAQNSTNGQHKSKSSSPTRSRSRSPTRHQSSYTRNHRHRSRSNSKERRHEKRRDRDGYSSRENDYEDNAEGGKEPRPSGDSVDASTRRSSHRTHDYEKESSKSKHRSHRSHREGSRSRDKEYHSSRKRSRTPDFRINGASRSKETINGGISNRPVEEDEQSRYSRKRRDRDEESSYRDRKRSRRDEDDYPDESNDSNHRSRHNRHEDKDSRSEPSRTEKSESKAVERPKSPPKGPKIDQHALEREARNRERQMKEIQRRAVMEGKGAGSKAKVNGRAGERRHSYKYEDEDLASRVEKERESGRWN